MADQQYLSTDPQAGASVPATGSHPEAKMSASMPGLAWPAGAEDEATRPVTLNDLVEDPHAALSRIGQQLKRDATDPKTWLTLAAMYFAPKVLPKAMPLVNRAAASASEFAGRVEVHPSAALDIKVNQPLAWLKNAVSLKPEGTATAPAETAPGGAAPPVDRPASAPPATPDPSPAAAPGQPKSDTVYLGANLRTQGQMSPQWIANDLGVAARRAGMTLTQDQLQAASQVVQQTGASPWQVMQTLKQGEAPTAPTLATPKPKIEAETVGLYLKLRAQGMSDQEARAAIANPAFAKLPTDADVASTVAAKNAKTTPARGGTKPK